MQYRTQDSEGELAGAFGADIRGVPPQVLEEAAQPYLLGQTPETETDEAADYEERIHAKRTLR